MLAFGQTAADLQRDGCFGQMVWKAWPADTSPAAVPVGLSHHGGILRRATVLNTVAGLSKPTALVSGVRSVRPPKTARECNCCATGAHQIVDTQNAPATTARPNWRAVPEHEGNICRAVLRALPAKPQTSKVVCQPAVLQRDRVLQREDAYTI